MVTLLLSSVWPVQGSKNGSDLGSQGMKKTEDGHTDRKSWGLDRVGSLMEKPQYSRSSMCLLYRAQHVYYIELNREVDYCIHINKKVGSMVYSWAIGTGLGDLGKSSL